MDISWVFQFFVENPELGWIAIFAYLIIELRTPRGRLYNLDKKITSSIIVIRAIARVHDELDEDEVDNYLVENGMEPGDFIVRDKAKTTPDEIAHADPGNESPNIDGDVSGIQPDSFIRRGEDEGEIEQEAGGD